MSYTKQTWTTGDTVTATKLNHMEDGIAGAGGGFDIVIKIDKAPDDVNISESDLHLVQGDHASVLAKATAGEPITIFASAQYTDDGDDIYASAYFCNFFINITNAFISFAISWSQDGSLLMPLYIDSNDEVHFN